MIDQFLTILAEIEHFDSTKNEFHNSSFVSKCLQLLDDPRKKVGVDISVDLKVRKNLQIFL